MPPWFIDIESATEMEAKSNGTPPSSRTAAAASRANSPSSALHGVTRPSVEAMPTKGLAISASVRPSARRKARCGARSSPSTVMREGSFFVFMHDLVDGRARRQTQRPPVDIAAAAVVVDQYFADQLLRAVRHARQGRRLVGDDVGQIAAVYRNRGGENELRAVAGKPAGFEQIAGRVQVHLGAELEIGLGPARDQGREMEYHLNFPCDQRARKLRIGDIADDGIGERPRHLVCRNGLRLAERTYQRGTDVAPRAGDEYSHGGIIPNRK